MPRVKTIIVILTVALTGRMMTLAFLHRAGRGEIGDPPVTWLMPLIGDAVIGLSGVVIAVLLARSSALGVWLAALIWNAIGIWDALSAYIVHRTAPWDDFFMIQIFGSSMFFMASAMHMVLIILLLQESIRYPYLSGEVARSRPS